MLPELIEVLCQEVLDPEECSRGLLLPSLCGQTHTVTTRSETKGRTRSLAFSPCIMKSATVTKKSSENHQLQQKDTTSSHKVQKAAAKQRNGCWFHKLLPTPHAKEQSGEKRQFNLTRQILRQTALRQQVQEKPEKIAWRKHVPNHHSKTSTEARTAGAYVDHPGLDTNQGNPKLKGIRRVHS